MKTIAERKTIENWRGLARDERADGWVVERSWTAVPRRWRAVVTAPDGEAWTLHDFDYERLIATADDLVEHVKARRAGEAA